MLELTDGSAAHLDRLRRQLGLMVLCCNCGTELDPKKCFHHRPTDRYCCVDGEECADRQAENAKGERGGA